MTSILSAILSVSLVALIFGSVSLEFKRCHSRRLVRTGAVVAIALGIFILDAVQTKGPTEDITAVIFCYLAMLLGMVFFWKTFFNRQRLQEKAESRHEPRVEFSAPANPQTSHTAAK